MRIPELWMGDEASFDALLRSYLLFQEAPPPKLFTGDEDDEEGKSLVDRMAEGLSAISGRVGVININGPLVAEADFWAMLFGAVPYPVIDKALENFSANAEVDSILLNIGSNGGDAVGVDEVSQRIKFVGETKPVHSWSGSRALSAGYWLGSSAKSVNGTRMAEFGSIGVISTHTSVARMLKEKGVDVTVVRAGKYKALGHPYEKLSDDGLDLMKEKANKLYGFFIDHVADRRGLSAGSKDQWAEGRTFFGDEARSVGLIDSVVSLRDMIQRLNISSKPKEQSMPKQVYLSQEAAAAVASGVSLESVPHEEVEVEEPEASTESVSGEASPPVLEGHEVTAAQASAPQAETELVTFLRQELTSERAKTVALEQKLALAETALTNAKTAQDELLPVVIEATQRMMIGLNQTPMDMSDLPPSVVASQYAKVKAAFESTYRVGRQSLESQDTHREVPRMTVARQLGITEKKTSTIGSHPTWS